MKPILIEDLGTSFPLPTSVNKQRFGIFKCPYCNNLFRAQVHDVKCGHTSSCGCRSGRYKHGLSKHPLNCVWRAIKGRCGNKNNPDYRYYGNRGIKVCEEWINDFINFYNWAIINGYKKGLEIVAVTCFDKNRETWLSAINEDSTNMWYHVATVFRNGETINEELALDYPMGPIPRMILIDKEGKVRGSWEGYTEENENSLDKKLVEIFNN